MNKKVTISLLFSAIFSSTVFSLPKLGKSPLPEVINALTPDEKIRLCMGTGIKLYTQKTCSLIGIDSDIPGTAMSFPVKRLGIPSIYFSDGPSGLNVPVKRKGKKDFYATAFPCASVMAQTWNKELEDETGYAIAQEAASYGVNVLLGPAMNIIRNPLGGRNWEYFSEDPVASGKMAASFIRGIQKNNIAACAKHFACNNQEAFRFNTDARVSEEALDSIYLKGFKIAIDEGNPWTIMTSYNKINGVYTSESQWLNNQLLRGQWNYNGAVMTDWYAGNDGAAQIKACQDLIMPGTDQQYVSVLKAYKKGLITDEELNRNVERVLNLILKTKEKKNSKPDFKANRLLARKAAAEGIILLKNEDTLPLKAGSTVSFWPEKNEFHLIAGGTGAGTVNVEYISQLDKGLFDAGYSLSESPDAYIFVLNRNSGEFKDRQLREFYLSSNEKEAFENMAEKAHSEEKKLIVILNVPGPVETASWINKTDAVILSGYAGMEIGNALADIISGKVNPSGRLAQTFPVDYFDVPGAEDFPYNFTPDIESLYGVNYTFKNRKNLDYTEYSEDSLAGYRWYTSKNVKPAFPFGYGLSYTTFDQQITDIETKDGKTLVKVKVTNTGTVSGKHAVLLFSENTDSEPAKELQDFSKTKELLPQESQILILESDLAAESFVLSL